MLFISGGLSEQAAGISSSITSIPVFTRWRHHAPNSTGQAHGNAPYTLGSVVVNGLRLWRRPCGYSTCQEIFGDLTSKRDTLCLLLITGSKWNIFLRIAINS